MNSTSAFFRRVKWPGAVPRIRQFAVVLAAAMVPGTVYAAGPVGEWWVHDMQARIRIVDCDGAMWGIIAWEAMPGVDTHNPDPQLRNRPMLGVPIILGMKAKGDNKWQGMIYNSAFGQTVSGSIDLPAADKLRITGCVAGILCGGEDWSRFETTAATVTDKSDDAVCNSVSAAR